MRISHLAGLLSVPWEGADGEVTAAASLESATGGHLSFVGNRKAAVAGSSSLAGCLIVPPEFPAGRTLMRDGLSKYSVPTKKPLIIAYTKWAARGL